MVFKTKNLSFQSPKKDLCPLCTMYKEGSDDIKAKLQLRYEKHVLEKNTVKERNQEKM